MENAFERTDNLIDNTMDIVIHYKLMHDSKIYKLILSPREYFWSDTLEIDGYDGHRNAVERYSDYRDYIVRYANRRHDDVELLITVVKNYITKECKSYFSFYFDGKSLTFTQSCHIDNIPDASAIFSMITDEYYDVARIDVSPNVPVSEYYSNIRFYRIKASQHDDNVLITSNTTIKVDEIY